MSATPTPFCPINPECDRRFDQMDKRLDDHSGRLRLAEIGLGKLQAQVALAAGIGSLIGGGIVTMVVQVMKP